MADQAEPVRKASEVASAEPPRDAADRPELAGHRALLQRREVLVEARSPQPVQRAAAPNRTGLPDRLKAGVESLSGLAMDHVRVHRSSAEPARLGALAYAQGTDIHLAPGQEAHLPHEAWHVVQQMQGRVKPTRQMKTGVAINDSAALEREADAMGAQAAAGPGAGFATAQLRQVSVSAAPVQRRVEESPSPEPAPERQPGKKVEGESETMGKEPEYAPTVRAAYKAIEKAAKESKGTIELNDKLQNIGEELGLVSIALVELGTPKAAVAFQVNPWFWWPLQNSTTAIIWQMIGTETKPVTNVRWVSDNLSIGGTTSKVGTRMLAEPLATDHEPGSVSTYDSDQDGLMGKLANAGNTRVANDQKYIKGHLLNDHVGGPGASFNLFPITADANAKHLAFVEKYVKAQLTARNVIHYEIDVAAKSPVDLSTTGGSGFSIDAEFRFLWYLLDTGGKKLGKDHKATVISTYNAKGAEPFDVTIEYAGEYDKLNRGKSSPKAKQQANQWQMDEESPEMEQMGKAEKSKTPIPVPQSVFGTTTTTTNAPIDFNGVPVKKDSSKSFFISVRNKDAPDDNDVGKDMVVGNGATVKIISVSPLGGGWTRVYF